MLFLLIPQAVKKEQGNTTQYEIIKYIPVILELSNARVIFFDNVIEQTEPIT